MSKKLKRIVDELKELESLTLQCMKCGVCQSVCPLYQKDFFEPSVARGKISLIEALYQGRIESVPGVIKYLDYCILCGRCKRFCPSSVNIDEIFVRAKGILREIDELPFYQKALLKSLIESADFLTNFQPVISVGMKLVSKSAGESGLRTVKFPIKKSVAPVSPKSFNAIFGGLNRAESEKMRVIFYPGCAISYIFVEWGEAVVGVLNHFGVSVYVPEKNRCCGIPAATMGEIDMYKKMAKLNHDWFSSIDDAEYVITACPTCGYGLFDLGVRVAGLESSKKHMDIMVFLKEILNVKLNKKTKGRSTLHIPCHYEHEYDKTLIGELSELNGEFEPLENQSCCGFGGTFSLKHPGDSKEVGAAKMDEVKSKGFEKLYSPCPGCVMQLSELALDRGVDVKVEHPVMDFYRLIKEGGA